MINGVKCRILNALRSDLGRSLACLQHRGSELQTNTSPWHGPEETEDTLGGTKTQEREGEERGRRHGSCTALCFWQE